MMVASKAALPLLWSQQSRGWNEGAGNGTTFGATSLTLTPTGTGSGDKAYALTDYLDNAAASTTYRLTFKVTRSISQADSTLDVVIHRPTYNSTTFTIGDDVGDETSTSEEEISFTFNSFGSAGFLIEFKGISDTTIQTWTITDGRVTKE